MSRPSRYLPTMSRSLMLSLPSYLPQIEDDCQEMKGRRGANQKMSKVILAVGAVEADCLWAVLKAFKSDCVAAFRQSLPNTNTDMKHTNRVFG